MSTVTTPRIVPLKLDPLDVLFFRDGRPFGAATRASTGQPMPQTVAGAIWTALLERNGCDFSKLAVEVKKLPAKATEPQNFTEAIIAAGGPAWGGSVGIRGPWLARVPNTNVAPLDVLVPMPATLHEAKHKPARGEHPALYRLDPLSAVQSLPGWQRPASGMRPLWLRQKETTEAATGYLTGDGLRAFLNGRLPARQHVVRSEDLFGFDHRTGIEIAADQLSAKEGGIYGASFLALRSAYTAREADEARRNLSPVVLYVEVVLPDDAPVDACDQIVTVPLGGEGRRARVTRVPRYEWPEGSLAAEKQAVSKPLLLLTTPGLFEAGWLPKAIQKLVAAAVPAYVAVSGWDLARGGPKRTRFACAPGSVYFLDSAPAPLPDSLSDRSDDRLQGWGSFVRGVWNDE